MSGIKAVHWPLLALSLGPDQAIKSLLISAGGAFKALTAPLLRLYCHCMEPKGISALTSAFSRYDGLLEAHYHK